MTQGPVKQLAVTAKKWFISSSQSPLTEKERTDLLIRLIERWDIPDVQAIAAEIIVTDTFTKPEQRSNLLEIQSWLLVGTIVSDPVVRAKFFLCFEKIVEHNISKRVEFVLDANTWNIFMYNFHVYLAVNLILSAMNEDAPLKLNVQLTHEVLPSNTVRLDLPYAAKDLINEHHKWIELHNAIKLGDLLGPLRDVLHKDEDLARSIWLELIPLWHKHLTTAEKEHIQAKITDSLSRPEVATKLRNTFDVIFK